MNYDETSDQQLLRAFHAGDILAFSALVRRHQDAIYRLCHSWLFDTQRSEDASQEVFLRAFARLPRFRFRSAPYTWLYRTARLVCHEFNRERRHETTSPDDHAGPASDPATKDRALIQLLDEVRKLPQRQREVITLRVFENLSVRETAKLMGCREGTVKALVFKAKATLRKRLAPHEDTA